MYETAAAAYRSQRSAVSSRSACVTWRTTRYGLPITTLPGGITFPPGMTVPRRDDAVLAHLRRVHDDCAHADQRAAADIARVQDRAVPDRHIFADGHTQFARVQHTPVLYVGVFPDRDFGKIAPDKPPRATRSNAPSARRRRSPRRSGGHTPFSPFADICR